MIETSDPQLCTAAWASFYAALADFTGWTKVVLPPLIAAFLSGYLVNRAKTREDQVDRRIDELCADAGEVAKNAATYWSKSPAEHKDEESILSTKIIVGLAKVARLQEAMSSLVSKKAGQEMVAAEQKLLRELTGGDFGSAGRTADIEKAKQALFAASEYVTSVRKARMLDLRKWKRRK